jgi:hypothetical protein
LFARYATERTPDEGFGDFLLRHDLLRNEPVQSRQIPVQVLA